MRGAATKRLFWNTAIPIAVGAIFFDSHDAVGGICTRVARLFSLLWPCIGKCHQIYIERNKVFGLWPTGAGHCQLVECQLRPLVLGIGFWYTAHHLWNMDVV